ncbi:MAG TPA: ADP-ribosylglycohydrolase family protein [Chthonomonadaceae bacterium]|nr:ADP-ribosylglycohydrolase family protein [Chthonomonadaceae bacterium]
MAALTLATEVYRDRVLGGWIGKSAGVTLGQGVRGQLTPAFLNFYNPVPGQPVPSVALDFATVWLEAVEHAGAEIGSEALKQAWLDRLDYTQDEYGYAALNMRRGLPWPACGAHSNWFRQSTGAIVRADLWAMVAPGNPQAAAALAYHDAVLDHCEEGVWSAMFLAAVGSAAFFIQDMLSLLTIGLAMIPRTCRSARAVKTALAAGQRGASWLEARESVQHEVGDKNFTDVPQNLGFLAIGMLYGMHDFGSSLCSAVNCGYDSEATGGALGALLGIMRGANGLPADWTRPVGDVLIPGAGVRDVQGVLSLSALADRTAAIGRQVALVHCTDIEIADAPAPPAAYSDAGAIPPPASVAPQPVSPTAAPAFTPFNAPPPGAAAPEAASGETPLSSPQAQTAGVPAPAVGAPARELAADTAPSSASADSGGSPALAPPPASSLWSAEPTPTGPVAAQPAAYAPPSSPAPQPPGTLAPQPVSETPGTLTPQPVSEQPAALVEPDRPAAAPDTGAAAPLAPDPMSAIAWADSALVKPLLVTPTNAFVGQAGPFEIHLDTGDSPAVGFNQVKTLAVTVFNRGEEPFSGRLSLLAPPGWQVASPASFGQRQYVAAHTGTLRAEFRLQATEGQARIDIANSIAIRLTPDSGGAPAETQFVIMGAGCWWTVGTFANFDGEGFDRSYLPEDRPGLQESYVARTLQSVRWEKRTFPESVLDLEPIFRGSAGVCYGQTVLRSAYNREARLTAVSNNGVKVWMSGSLVMRRHQRTTFRPVLNEENWSADISLREGDNPIMVKWVRGSEPYQFSLTVSDRQGRALPDVGNTWW